MAKASVASPESDKITSLGETRATLLDYLRTMCEIRNFEDKVYSLLREGAIKGASHLYAGQEAVAVGAIAVLEDRDVIASTHRGHGHCGAMGRKHARTEQERQDHWNKMMAELMGKQTGYCKGRGGSMHIADVEKGNLGSTGIVGGNIPIGTGAALAEKLKGEGAIVLCFFGDGATNTGSFHESLNMGSTLLCGLPIVYICENNLYGMSVPFHNRSVDCAGQASNIEDIADRASSYGMAGEVVDGMDVLAVKEAVMRAAAKARDESVPTLIECKTYRWYGHSSSDQRVYRTRDEEKDWQERCPISVLRKKLLNEGIATEEELDAVAKMAEQTIETATQFAMESPFPDVADLYNDIYVPVDKAKLRIDTAAEAGIRAKVRPIEDEVRAMAREASGGNPKAALPKLKADAAKSVQDKHRIPVISYGQAIVDAHREEMKRDESVVILGEDVGIYGGAYAATRGLLDEFGTKRVMDTAISEAAIAGAAGGAAMRGLRPVAEIMYIDFATISSDQIIHNVAYNRYMFGGKTKVPCVIRTEGGVGRCIAAHHSESLEAWFMHIPGLYVVMPSTPYDAKGLLKASIRDDNPVIFIEHKVLYSGVMGPVPTEDYIIPLGVADIKRPGTDVTIIAYCRMLHFALDAAIELEKLGISAEVVDPRTLQPLDVETLANSIRKTGRVITVSEGYPRCGVGPEIVRQACEHKFENGYTGFDYLDAQPIYLSGKDCPIPMSEPLEDAVVPTRQDIVDAARWLTGD
ncbi:MAG: pyruvate dehydrogenase complex E1 component subunit beta [Armatimonadota bacterium]|nr:pyruvate dehydrogenase complex E1 component subunit beta [Armatimonadota bacterium]